jgi:hypothetical protein
MSEGEYLGEQGGGGRSRGDGIGCSGGGVSLDDGRQLIAPQPIRGGGGGQSGLDGYSAYEESDEGGSVLGLSVAEEEPAEWAYQVGIELGARRIIT